MHSNGISVLRISVSAFVFSAIIVCARAQDSRTSTVEGSVSLGFQVYFAPFVQVDTAVACADICVKDARCEGWTYYHSDYKDTMAGSEELPRMCIVGAVIKGRISNMPGRTSGQIK